jgi:hypothetical protein
MEKALAGSDDGARGAIAAASRHQPTYRAIKRPRKSAKTARASAVRVLDKEHTRNNFPVFPKHQ